MIKKINDKKFFNLNETINFKEMRKNFEKNPKLNYLRKKCNGEIPFFTPIMDIHDKIFNSNSQKNRFEKNYQILLNIKNRIQNDNKNAKLYIKEVKFGP